jgi:hypothetical protein
MTCDIKSGCVVIDHPELCEGDDIACTTDTCMNGNCLSIPNNTYCQHYPYNHTCSMDVCNASLGCVSSKSQDCDDGIACSFDQCLEGKCTHTPNDVDCSQHNTVCAKYTCNVANGCEAHRNDALCSDDILCTKDSCTIDGECAHIANNSLCGGGQGCVVAACETGVGCTTIKRNDLCPPLLCMTPMCVDDGTCSYTPISGCGDLHCDTAFGMSLCENETTCFIDIPNLNANRWGWTNGPYQRGNYTLALYRGAGQCDLSKGSLIGWVSIQYTGSNAIITYHAYPGVFFVETHTYVGNDILPKICNPHGCKYTVAPGQYPQGHSPLPNTTVDTYVFTNLNGEIYVITHAEACGNTHGPCIDGHCNDNNQCSLDICNELTGACEHKKGGCPSGTGCCGSMCINNETNPTDEDCKDGGCFHRWCDPIIGGCASAPIPGCVCNTNADCDDGTLLPHFF